jgi:H+/Cl- antiporter ClcA
MWESYFVGMMKLAAIGITVASSWPGGIFFPLFMAAASIGSALLVLLRAHCKTHSLFDHVFAEFVVL